MKILANQNIIKSNKNFDDNGDKIIIKSEPKNIENFTIKTEPIINDNNIIKSKQIINGNNIIKTKPKTDKINKKINLLKQSINLKTKSFKIKTKKAVKILKDKLSFLKVDFSFFIVFFLALFSHRLSLFFTYTFFIILHEMVHYIQAKKLGYLANKIHLSFFGASLEGLDDFTIQDELRVIISAPLFNLIIALLCYICFWFYPESYNFLYDVLIANLSIFVFNMLPVYPLDFGRIILAFLSKKYMRKKALKITKIISFFFIIIIFFFSITSFIFKVNISIGFVALNLMNMLFKSSKSCSYKRELFLLHKSKLISKGLLERNIYISQNTNLYSLLKFIDGYHFVNFYFVDENYNVTKTISEIDIYKKLGYY